MPPSLIHENKALKTKINCLTYDLSRFFQGQENIDIMLGSQRKALDKSNLGYNDQGKIFQSSSKQEKISRGTKTCYACCKKGHISYQCINKIKKVNVRRLGS